MKSTVLEFVKNFDPTFISEMTGEELAEAYSAIRDLNGVLEAQKKEIGQILLTKIEADGKVFGHYAVSKVPRPSYSKVSLGAAKELGAVKEVIDGELLGKLIKKGVKVDGVTYTYSPKVTDINEKTE